MNISMQVRLKQGDIVEALEKEGWTQRQGAEFLGLSYERFNALVNLQWVPKEFSPKLTIKLHELTGKKVEELFPEWARRQGFLAMPKVARKMMEVGPHMLNGAGTFHLPPGPEEVFNQHEVAGAIEGVLDTLTPREKDIVKRVIMGGEHEEEVARRYNVTGGRINQIKLKALRKLRQPVRSSQLREFLP